MDKKRIFQEFLGLILLTMLLIFGNIIIKSKNSEERVTNKISSSLEKIQSRHDSLTFDFKNNFLSIISEPEKFYPINPTINSNDGNAKYCGSTEVIYIFKNDSLIYWNSDQNDPETLLKKNSSEKNIFTQGNNQFFLTFIQIDSLKFFTSTPLYYKNPNISDKNIFLPEKINGSYEIDFNINDNKINFNINYQAKMNHLDAYLLGLLLIIIFIKSLILTYKVIKLSANSRQLSVNSLFFIASCLIYLIIIILQNNLFLSTSDLFGI